MIEVWREEVGTASQSRALFGLALWPYGLCCGLRAIHFQVPPQVQRGINITLVALSVHVA